MKKINYTKLLTNPGYQKQPLIERIYLFLFVILPIVNQYQIGFLSFMQVYTLFGSAIWILCYKKHPIRPNIILYIIYTAIISCVGFLWLNEGPTLQLILRLIAFVLLVVNFYIVFPCLCNKGFILKLYTIVVYTVTVLFFIQYLVFVITGKSFMLLVPNVTLNYNQGLNSSEMMSLTLGRIYTGYYFRPSSLFIEPVFHAIYCIPWLVIKLFSMTEMRWKDIVGALIVTASMILTTSSMAIIICVIVWVLFIISVCIKGNRRLLRSLMFSLPLIVIAVVYVFNTSGVLTSIAIKMNSFHNLNEASSLTWRVLRGFECYKHIGVFQQIFGCGYGDVANYLNAINLRTIYDSNLTLIDYMSGAFYMLCSIGIVGSTIMISILFPYIKNGWRNAQVKMLTLCLILIMFSAAIFDSDKFFLFVGAYHVLFSNKYQ